MKNIFKICFASSKRSVLLFVGAVLVIFCICLAIFFYDKYSMSQPLKFPEIKNGQSINIVEFVAGFNNFICNFAPKIKGLLIQSRYGHKLLVDVCDNAISISNIDTYEWEPELYAILSSIVKPGNTVVYVGGHIGTKVLNLANFVDSTGSIHVFEPNSINFGFLEKNLKINNITNVKTYRIAAHSKKGTVAFDAFNRGFVNTGLSRLSASKEVSESVMQIEVEADKLDNIIKSPVDVMIIDSQGSDAFVIEGAHELIHRSPNLIVLERWSAANISVYSKPSSYLKFWRDKGYKFFALTSQGLQEVFEDLLLRYDMQFQLLILNEQTAARLFNYRPNA